VVQVKDRDGSVDSTRIFVIESLFETASGNLTMRGRHFQSVRPAFTKPYDSTEIGVYHCSTPESWMEENIGKHDVLPFDLVTGKYFPFPLLKVDQQPGTVSKFSVFDKSLSWVMVRLRHTEEGSDC
jgi:hypothetical protein